MAAPNGLMDYIFPEGGSTSDPKVLLKNTSDGIRTAARMLEREKERALLREKRLQVELSNHATRGENSQLKGKARELVRTRRSIDRFSTMVGRMQILRDKLPQIQAAHTMAQALGDMNKAMRELNRGLALPELGKLITSFQKQMARFEEKSDAIDGALDEIDELDDKDEAEVDLAAEKVVDELKLTRQAAMARTPVDDLAILESRLKGLNAPSAEP